MYMFIYLQQNIMWLKERRGWWKVECSLLFSVHIHCRNQNLKTLQVFMNEMKQQQHQQSALSLMHWGGGGIQDFY